MARTAPPSSMTHDGAFGDAVFLAVLAQIVLERILPSRDCRFMSMVVRAIIERIAGLGGEALSPSSEGPVEEIVGVLRSPRSTMLAGCRRACSTWPSVMKPPCTRLVSTTLARARGRQVGVRGVFRPAP